MSSKRKILVVDDSEINRSLLSDMLMDQFDMLEAENGLEAAAIIQSQEQNIALILLDITMPVMDGFELLELMNKKGWIKNIPVIMISAETASAYIDRAYDLGALEYISRPFDERTVRHRVMTSIMFTAKQKEFSMMVAEQMIDKERTNRLMVEILSNIVEFRNGESGLHAVRIQAITQILLNRLIEMENPYNLTEADCQLISNASVLHDIGKIAIPSEILNKPGRLTQEEFAVVKTHSLEGAKLLEGLPESWRVPLLQYAYQIARGHHERYDGKGYPDGLKGDEIPIAAQVVAVADVYDALTSKRCYKPPITHDNAIEMIKNGECGAFNPLLMQCLTDVSSELNEKLQQDLVERYSENEILHSVNNSLQGNELSASERTLRLLERERTKQNFYAEISNEIWFEYTVMPEVVTLSEWGAGHLNLPETIVKPEQSEFANVVFRHEDYEDLLEKLKNTTPENPIVEATYLLNVNGHERWHKVCARSMWSGENEITYEGAVGKIVDIHEEVEKLRYLERMSEQDTLTGLLNQQAAKMRISSLLEDSSGKKKALMFFDLDNFKRANDERGHLFGNEVLKFVADSVRKCIRNNDVAARVGGDEFVVFAEYKDEILPLIKRIFDRLTVDYDGFPIRISMGIAFADQCDMDYERLYHMADTAMYTVKKSGKSRYCFYDPSMDQGMAV